MCSVIKDKSRRCAPAAVSMASMGEVLLGWHLVLHAIAAAFNGNGFSVVEEPVQDGRGDGAVVVENGGPGFESFVGGQNNGSTLVALADHLEEHIGSALVDRQIADLIKLCGVPHNLMTSASLGLVSKKKSPV